MHGVVNGHPGGNRAARTVYVQKDVFVRVFGFEKEHLGDGQVRDLIVDRRADEDDAVLEKAGEDVVRALAAIGLFDDHRHQLHARVITSSVMPHKCVAELSGKIACGVSYESPPIVARAMTKSIDFSRRKPA